MIKRIINRIRFISFTKNEPYFVLRNLLGFSPKENSYYQLALLHRSTGKRNINGVIIDNERLEFLGDAILSAIISDYLYQKFPLKKEGFLVHESGLEILFFCVDHIAVLTIYNAGYIILFQTVRLHHPVFKQNQGCFFEKKSRRKPAFFA